MKKVIIIGGSGHGKVVADIVINSGDEVAGFLDDDESIKECAGLKVLGKPEDYKKYACCEFVIAVGNAEIREKISTKMPEVKWYTAINPTATVSKLDVKIGDGTVIMPGAIINAGTKIGKHCIINSGAIVEHDNVIEDFSHISVGAKLGGTVTIGKSTWVGIGATVSNNIEICGGCTIGAGAVVVKDITENGTYVGVPARKIAN